MEETTVKVPKDGRLKRLKNRIVYELWLDKDTPQLLKDFACPLQKNLVISSSFRNTLDNCLNKRSRILELILILLMLLYRIPSHIMICLLYVSAVVLKEACKHYTPDILGTLGLIGQVSILAVALFFGQHCCRQDLHEKLRITLESNTGHKNYFKMRTFLDEIESILTTVHQYNRTLRPLLRNMIQNWNLFCDGYFVY